MNNSYRTAYVYVDNYYSGTLSETENGYCFRYDDNYFNNYNKPVSLTLPLKNKEYNSNTLFPFFDGLIPEGWLLKIITDNWKINPKDRFGILLEACDDCIGNVSIQSKFKGEYYEQ